MQRVLSLLALAGCTLGGLTPVEDTGIGTDEGNDTGSTNTDSGNPEAFDPYAGLGPDQACEDFEGTPYTGATGYFVGEFSYSEGVLTGHEDWLLYANSTWQASNGYDCFLRWDAFGTISGATSCVGCSHEIQLDLTFNGEESNCPQDLENIEGQDGNVTYYVQAQANGDARFEFTDGDFLGDGVLANGRAAYVSDPQCNVF